VITGDLPDVASATYGSIDDLVIETSVEAIDGPGNILGSAGPRGFRTASDGGLPYIGAMRFDSADLAYMEQRGILGDIVEHEMGHVLGILNGFFAQRGLLGPSGLDFTGANAVAQYRVVAGNGSLASVPLESLGGAGTRGHHWTESIFDEELMTGWAENAPPMPLSVVTVGALADLGYAVNYAAADPFSF
jgi:hypothetical protein